MKPMVFTLVWNRVEHTKWCFSQLQKLLGPRDKYYWVVLDNYSTDGAREWLQKTEGDYDKLLLTEYNLGMVHGRNRGLTERDKHQDVLHIQGDQDIQGSENIIECFQVLIERIKTACPREKIGVVHGDYANWYDGWPQYGPDHFAKFVSTDYKIAWSKSAPPPKYSQSIDQRAMWMTSELLDETGYWCELTTQSDQEFPFRTANAGFIHWGTRAILWNLERYHSVGTKPLTVPTSARGLRRDRGLSIWGLLHFNSWVDKHVYGEKQCYRGTIWDPVSIERWNPIIEAPSRHRDFSSGDNVPKDFKGTYEEWSRCNLEYFKKYCQDDSASLEEMNRTPTEEQPCTTKLP